MLLIALSLVALPALGYQPFGLALALGVIAGFIGVHVVLSRRQHRSLLQELIKVDNRVSKVEYRTQPVHDIRGSVVKTSVEMREVLAHLRELADGGVAASPLSSDERHAAPSQSTERSVFAPGAIPANAIQGRPRMHIAGRDAATQDMNHPGERNLARVLLAAETALRREIAYIGGQGLIPSLESVGSITGVAPGMGEAALSVSTSYFVIDLDTLSETPWRGALDASRTRLFQELRTIVMSARKMGIVVVVHGDDVPSHFTASLENLAHVRIRNNGLTPTRWGHDVNSALIDAISASKAHAPTGEGTQRR